MRQSFTFVFALVFLIFPGCSRNAAPAQDFAYQYHKAQNVQTLQESDSGYYFGRMRHLTYIDKSTLAEVPLCAKPNCSHGDGSESSPALVIFDAEGRELERLDLATLPCGRPGMLSVFPTFGSDVLFSAVCGDRVFLYRFPKSAIGSGALPLEPLGIYNWY